jgi:hypothetical protein
LLALGAAPQAFAEKSSDNLRVVWRDAIPNIDPSYDPPDRRRAARA